MQTPKTQPEEPQWEESRLLARMMDLDESVGRLWSSDELGAILRHQLDAQVDFDLGTLGDSPRQTLTSFHAGGGLPIHSFRDLFNHPRPPLELLAWTKQFAKTCRGRKEGPVPEEVATVLYFLSIVTAMTKCEKRISRLDDQSLRYGLRWALAQPWLDDQARECFRDAIQANWPE